MKKNLLYIITCLLLIISCKKANNSPSLAGIIAPARWKVSLMKENGLNVTPAYEDWEFNFKTNKTLIVTDGIDLFTGNWKEDTERQKFILTINTSEIELITISREWDIDFKTPNLLRFKDSKISPKQELHFTKLP